MSQVGHLNALQEKYFDKGLRIVAISNESPGTVKGKFVEGAGAKFWVGVDPAGQMLQAFGGGGIPHAYLVDASGTIVADTHPASLEDARLEELLKDAFDAALGRDLHASLKPLQKLYEKGEIGKAWAGAEKPAAAGGEPARDAQFLRERAEACAAWRKTLAEKAIAAKDFGAVIDDLKEIPAMFAGMEVAGWAVETKKKLDADPSVGNEVKAFDALAKARALEAKAEGKAKKLAPAKSAYKSIVKKYPGTTAAKLAEEALARLPE